MNEIRGKTRNIKNANFSKADKWLVPPVRKQALKKPKKKRVLAFGSCQQLPLDAIQHETIKLLSPSKSIPLWILPPSPPRTFGSVPCFISVLLIPHSIFLSHCYVRYTGPTRCAGDLKACYDLSPVLIGVTHNWGRDFLSAHLVVFWLSLFFFIRVNCFNGRSILVHWNYRGDEI